MNTSDTVALFCAEIGRVPLLSRAEEIALAALVQLGRQAARQLRDGADSPALRHQVLAGMDARERLITSNLRLVVRIATRYAGRGVELADLIQEGAIGLMRAVIRFNPARGIPLAHYAAWWIRDAITRLRFTASTTIRLSATTHRAVGTLRRAISVVEQRLERAPTAAELAALLGWTESHVRRVLMLMQPARSLDAPGGQQIAASDSTERVVLARLEHADVAQVLTTLPARQQTVLALRYGLGDGRRRTLAEIGAQVGITREGVRRAEVNALRRLHAGLQRTTGA